MSFGKLIIGLGIGVLLYACSTAPPPASPSQVKKTQDTSKEDFSAQAMQEKLDQAWQRLQDIKADQYTPKEFAASQAQYEKAKAVLKTNVQSRRSAAETALRALTTHYDKLSARLDKVANLKEKVKEALAAAENGQAYIWVPDQLQEASDAYLQGTTAFKRWKLDSSEELWTKALYQAQAALAKANKEKERKLSEDLMLETMKGLEKASQTPAVTPEDQVISPSPWDGNKELDKLRKTAPSKTKQSLLIPADGTAVVMGEKSQITYLDEAKVAWKKGIEAQAAEDYTLANQYFLQAQKLVDAYMALSIDKIYTVRLIPGRRDCLWRIAEYLDIYNDPFQWPKIWLRNKKLIQNPDLIYPGWVLVIPR